MKLNPNPEKWPKWLQDEYLERAAIMEYDANMTRSDAERKAKQDVMAQADKQQGKLL